MWCWVIAAAVFLCWFMRDDDYITRGGRPRGPAVPYYAPQPLTISGNGSLPYTYQQAYPAYAQQPIGRLQPRDVVAVGPGPGYAPQTIAFRPPAVVLNTGSYQPPSIQVTQ
jgi:hypothetical protein